MSATFPCPTCWEPLTLNETTADGVPVYKCVNNHWWLLDPVTGWRQRDPNPDPVQSFELWTPNSLSGLRALLLPESLYGYNHGQPVSVWFDDGPLANHGLNAATDTTVPTYDASYGGARFDGSLNQFLDIVGIAGTLNDESFLSVWDQITDPGANNHAVLSGSTNAGRRYIIRGGANDDVSYSGIADSAAIASTLYMAPVMIGGKLGAANYSLYYNGNAESGSHAAAIGTTVGTRIGLTDTSTDPMTGVLKALVIFQTPYYDLDRQRVEGFLAHKFGITLPGAHPYFASAPTITIDGAS